MTRIPLAFAAFFLAAPAHAQSADLALLPGWRQSDGTHMAGIDIRLAPGWKTYWRVPGEAGIAPQFDWTGSTNVRDVTVHWPAPEVFGQNGYTSVGYGAGGVVLPITVTPMRAGAPVELSLSADIGVCEDICVPLTARDSVRLPATGTRDGRIAHALSKRPVGRRAGKVGGVRCEVAPGEGEQRLTVHATLPPLTGETAAVIEVSDPDLWVTPARLRRTGQDVSVTAEVVPPRGRPLMIDRSGVRLTLLGEGRAVQIDGCD